MLNEIHGWSLWLSPWSLSALPIVSFPTATISFSVYKPVSLPGPFTHSFFLYHAADPFALNIFYIDIIDTPGSSSGQYKAYVTCSNSLKVIHEVRGTHLSQMLGHIVNCVTKMRHGTASISSGMLWKAYVLYV